MDSPPFSELGLRPELLESVNAMGFEKPSPIQGLTIPAALSGKDLVGISQTGSGKTAAFGLPLLNKIDPQQKATQALVLCPTRELAMQVCEEIHRLSGSLKEIVAVPVYGGTGYDRQIRHLKSGAQVVVGTPGRLMDLMDRNYLRLENVRTVVLDEADRMLDMGFREDMEEILSQLPEDRQSLFFSATMNREVEGIISSFARNPETIQVQQKAKTVSTIDQAYYEVRGRSKIEVITRLLDVDSARLAIVFCNTKRAVDECTEALLARGYAADRLHGDITQHLRERVINRCREGVIEILVATDVAARGLDIDEVDVVFNYDLPYDPEDYVHRIGRTGRAGRSGRAVSFVFGREIHRLKTIERYSRQSIRREAIPTQEQVEGLRSDRLFDSLKERLEAGDYKGHDQYIDRLLDQGHTPTDIASALFTLWREETKREGEVIAEDRQRDRTERPPRNEREPKAKRDRKGGGDKDLRPGYARIFLSIGKASNANPKAILGMIYGESGIDHGSVGQISLFPKHSLVDIRDDQVEQVLKSLKKAKFRGKPFRADYDREFAS